MSDFLGATRKTRVVFWLGLLDRFPQLESIKVRLIGFLTNSPSPSFERFIV